MNGDPIRLTIGMRDGTPYGIDDIAPPPDYREDKCGIDLLEPYCSSTCPHDCISGQWESVHSKKRSNDDVFDVINSTNNVITIECGKLWLKHIQCYSKRILN